MTIICILFLCCIFSYTLNVGSSWGTKDQTAKELKFNGMVGMIQNDVNLIMITNINNWLLDLCSIDLSWI